MISPDAIVYNAIKTPDGTIIQSVSGHDYVVHKDKNGHTYGVDGGLHYLRRTNSQNAPAYKDISLTISDEHTKVRDLVKWGTYGKNGDQPLKIISVSEMSDTHLKAIIETQTRAIPQIIQVIKNELNYRLENSISIED